MKTILLILLSSCLGLCAQTATNDTNLDVDTALRDEILRSAVRQFGTNDRPPAPATTATNTATPAVVVVPPVAPPGSPPMTVIPPPTTRLAPAVSPTVAATQTNAVPATRTNPVTTPVIAPVVVNPPNTTAPGVSPVADPATGLPPTVAGPTVRQPGPRPRGPGMGPGMLPTPPAATVTMSEEADKKMNFPAIDLNTFLGVYAGIVERTVLHGPLPQVTISLETQKPLTRTELIQAMDSVLAMNNITMVNQGSNFVQAVTAAESGTVGGVFSTNRAEDIPESMQYISQIVQLKYVKPTEVMGLLTPWAKLPGQIYPLDSSSVLVIRDYAANVKRMMEVIKQVDVVTPIDYEQEIIPIKYAKVGDIASALSSLGAGAGTSIGTSTRGSTSTRGGLSGTGGGYTTGTSGLGGTATPGGGLSSPFGAGGARGATPPSLQNRLAGIANAARGAGGTGDIVIFTGPTKIVADERSHSLLVLAGHQDMEMVKSIVKKLDVVLQQVLIQAIIMEVNLDDELNLGVSYLQTSPSQGNYLSGLGALNNGTFLNNSSFINSGTNFSALPGGLSYLAHFGNDFDATVTAVASDSRINVLSKPQIQTSDGVPASFKVGDTIPYVTGTYFGGLNGQASSQYTQTFVGIDLEVTPQINSEGLVVMDVSQDIQELGPTTLIDGNQVPTTTQRTAVSTVSVKDRDTIILGGFISSTKSKSRSGVPVLKDVPLLGNLFRSSVDSTKRVELIVLIRPKVLPTPDAAAVLATHERDLMPGIKSAEAEIIKDQNKRLKQSDRVTLPSERQ